jgi:hypothetical protein
MVPSPEMTQAITPAPNKLSEAWDAIKTDPTMSNINRELNIVDAVGAFQSRELFVPLAS